jgi:Icc-related predicted phosphoesterase
MTGAHLNRILCAADPGGSLPAIERLLAAADEHDVDAIALLGDLGERPEDRANGYGAFFNTLARANRPVFWVPGADDAPFESYLREAYHIETAFPSLRGVHGTVAATSSGVLFAGFGGEINDDPRQQRDELGRLSYPRWEAEYHLKVLSEFDYNELVMLFWTAPAHKGLELPGSEVVAELIGTYRPRVAVCGGERNIARLGRSTTVAPGSLRDGHYALADLRKRTVEPNEL